MIFSVFSFSFSLPFLVFQELDSDEYEKWAANHEDAEMSLDEDREQLIFESAIRIEKDMELLGISGK